MTHFPQTRIFSNEPLTSLPCTISPIHCAKISKKLLEQIQRYEDGPFWGPKWSICHKQAFFFGKIINIIFIYLWNNFTLPNGSICPNQNISKNLLINLVTIIHAYLLHSKIQSQISIY